MMTKTNTQYAAIAYDQWGESVIHVDMATLDILPDVYLANQQTATNKVAVVENAKAQARHAVSMALDNVAMELDNMAMALVGVSIGLLALAIMAI